MTANAVAISELKIDKEQLISFFKLAEDQAELVFSKYNVLVEDKTKDEEYFLELKQKLQLRLQSKKAHDSRFFAYYVYHFKYYLFGACVV